MLDWILALGLGTVTIAAVGLPLRAKRQWEGHWKRAANLPLILLALGTLNIIIGLLVDPSSHNLFPLEILLWSLGSLGFIGLCTIIRSLQSSHNSNF